MKTSENSQRLILAILTAIGLVSWLASVQGDLRAQEVPTVRIQAGEIFEMTTDSSTPNAQYSWILTRDRKFQNAQRTRFFQTRFAEAGTYSLDVSIQNPTTGENAYRAFSIIVTETGEQVLPPIPSENNGVRTIQIKTEPGINQGVVYLPPAGGMLSIDLSPSIGTIDSYAVDLDAGVDTNGDGDPSNDADNQGTASEKAGTRFFLYALPSSRPRVIAATVSDIADPTISKMQFSIAFTNEVPVIASSASSQVVQNPNSPISMSIEGMDVGYEALLDPAQINGKQLIYEWDFGDRSRSLLDRPRHRYGFPGTYTVALTVRDIATAEILYSGTTSINILPEVNGSESSSTSSLASSTSSEASSLSSETQSGAGSSGSILKVLMIIFFLLLLAGGLYALLQWLKKRTALSIQKTLEKVEESIVKDDPKDDVIEASAVPTKMKKDEDEAAQPKKAPDIVISSSPSVSNKDNSKAPTTEKKPEQVTPPWLKNASSPKNQQKAEDDKPSSPSVKQNSDSPSPKKAEKTPSQPNGPVPDWLKPKSDPAKPPNAPPPPPKQSTQKPNDNKQTAQSNSDKSSTVRAQSNSSTQVEAKKETTNADPEQKVATPAALTIEQKEQNKQPEQKEEPKAPQQMNRPQGNPAKAVQPPTAPEKPASQPILPKAQQAAPEAAQQKDQGDPPIAIIQADSLSK